jgi:hypothetical protein
MEIYIGDVGKVLELEFRDYTDVDGEYTDNGSLDISSATEITFTFLKPDGTTVAKTQGAVKITLSGDGKDGKARYTSEAAFLDVAGTWRYQGKVEFGAVVHFSEPVEFPVKDPL